MKLLLRWVLISALTLANATVLAILIVVLYARAQVGHMMGRGPSVSEFAEPYVWLIVHSSLGERQSPYGQLLLHDADTDLSHR